MHPYRDMNVEVGPLATLSTSGSHIALTRSRIKILAYCIANLRRPVVHDVIDDIQWSPDDEHLLLMQRQRQTAEVVRVQTNVVIARFDGGLNGLLNVVWHPSLQALMLCGVVRTTMVSLVDGASTNLEERVKCIASSVGCGWRALVAFSHDRRHMFTLAATKDPIPFEVKGAVDEALQQPALSTDLFHNEVLIVRSSLTLEVENRINLRALGLPCTSAMQVVGNSSSALLLWNEITGETSVIGRSGGVVLARNPAVVEVRTLGNIVVGMTDRIRLLVLSDTVQVVAQLQSDTWAAMLTVQQPSFPAPDQSVTYLSETSTPQRVPTYAIVDSYHAATTAQKRPIPIDLNIASRVAISPCLKFLGAVSAQRPRTAFVLSVPDLSLLAVLDHVDAVTALRWQPQTHSSPTLYILTNNHGGNCFVWSPEAAACIAGSLWHIDEHDPEVSPAPTTTGVTVDVVHFSGKVVLFTDGRRSRTAVLSIGWGHS